MTNLLISKSTADETLIKQEALLLSGLMSNSLQLTPTLLTIKPVPLIKVTNSNETDSKTPNDSTNQLELSPTGIKLSGKTSTTLIL